MRYAISDEVRAVMGPIVERCKAHLGPPPQLSDRMFFEAVLYVARTGVPWRDLPAEFGARDAVYNRLLPWDHAAGWLLHREAGGYSARLDGSPYDVTDTAGGLICAPGFTVPPGSRIPAPPGER